MQNPTQKPMQKVYDPDTKEFDAHAARNFFQAITEHPEEWLGFILLSLEKTNPQDLPDEFLDYIEWRANLTPSEIREIESECRSAHAHSMN